MKRRAWRRSGRERSHRPGEHQTAQRKNLILKSRFFCSSFFFLIAQWASLVSVESGSGVENVQTVILQWLKSCLKCQEFNLNVFLPKKKKKRIKEEGDKDKVTYSVSYSFCSSYVFPQMCDVLNCKAMLFLTPFECRCYKTWCNSCVCQDDKSRKRKRKAERSYKDSSSESSVDSEGEEVVSIVLRWL